MLASRAFVVAVICIAASVATPFEACDEADPPVSLRVKGCDSDPCTFYRGEDVTAEWDFQVANDAEKLVPKVRVTILGGTLPYPMPEENSCDHLTNGECPLDEGEAVTYALKMPILPHYPKLAMTLEFSLVDETENVHVCFKINAQVADR